MLVWRAAWGRRGYCWNDGVPLFGAELLLALCAASVLDECQLLRLATSPRPKLTGM